MNRESERKRLVELIKQGDKTFADKYTGKVMSHIDEIYGFIADHLLDNGIVVPPVKVGQTVWYLHEIYDEDGDEHLDISEGKCEGISMQKDGLWIFCRYEDGLTYWHKNDKTLFTSREDAEKALEGR